MEIFSNPSKTLVLNGPVGVGKSTVAAAISSLLKTTNISHAVIDLDCLREGYPRPKEDPFHFELGMKNLASVWKNYNEAGCTHFIIPSVVEHPSELNRYQEAMPNTTINIVLLTAEIDTLQKRLEQREQGETLEWHKIRASELKNLLEKNWDKNLTIHTDQQNIKMIVEEILRSVHWM